MPADDFAPIEAKAKARGASAAVIEKMRRIHRQRAVAAEESAAQQGNVLRGVAGSVGAAGINFANAGTLGYLPKIVGAIGGDSSKVEDALAVTRQTNPTSSLIGGLGGYLVPGTPAARLTGLAAKAGAGIVRPGTAALGKVIGEGFKARAAAQVVQNIAGGSAAIAAARVAEQSEMNLQERVSRAVRDIATIENFALGAGMGVFQAKYMAPGNHEIRKLALAYERKTGRKLPADMIGDDIEVAKLIDTIKETPGLARDAHLATKRIVAGIVDVLDDEAMKRGVNPGKWNAVGGNAARNQYAAKGADALRGLLGTNRQFDRVAIKGKLTATRQNEQAAALAAEGNRLLTRREQGAIWGVLARGRKARAKSDVVDPEWNSVFDTVRKRLLENNLTVHELEAIRQRAAYAAGFTGATMSNRTRVEAGRFYDAIEATIDIVAPQYARANRVAARLHAIQESLADVKTSNVNDDVLAAFWSSGRGKAGDVIEKWRGAKMELTPEDAGALKGWYYTEIIKRSMTKDGLFSSARLRQMLDGGGTFSRQAVEEIMPGMTEWLEMAAASRDVGAMGSLAHPATRTFGRSMRAAGLAATSAGVASMATAIITNQYWAAAPILGAAAVKWIAMAQAKSLMNGHLGQVVSGLASGQRPLTVGPSAAAITGEGGLGGTGSALMQSASQGVNQGLGALQGLMQYRARGDEQ